MNELKLDEAKFKCFVQIRDSGVTNMLDIKRVCALSNNLLNEDDCLEIIENFEKYQAAYER